jgi:hypothetical protein
VETGDQVHHLPWEVVLEDIEFLVPEGLGLTLPVEASVLGRVVERPAWGIRLLARGLVNVLLVVEVGCGNRVPSVVLGLEESRWVSSV